MANYNYTEIYAKRLNKLGTDFQSRLEGQRAKEFEHFLLKSPNRVDFDYNGEYVAGVLEQLKEDASETQGYLLTRKETKLPNGTIIKLTDRENQSCYWLVWWLEQIKTSGYHRYIVLRMTHQFNWWDNDKKTQWGYLMTPGTKAFRDATVTGQGGAIFKENNNLYLLITPYQKAFDRDGYLEIANKDKINAYRIVELDNQAIDGVSYLSLEPIAKKDQTAAPVKTEGNAEEDFFWFGGGV